MKLSKNKKNKTVFVGMSGGVDSSVSALLLKEQGYEVVGVFIRTWHPDFIECNEEEERRDAMRVAAFLDIPFLTFDLEKEYRDGVAMYMIEEYKKGRTPNPDVMCNKEVKFGAFLKKALEMGADFVATGHYVQKKCLFFDLKDFSAFALGDLGQGTHDSKNLLNPQKDRKNFLVKSVDASKDQTYFLWTLDSEKLEKILFPIGHLKKEEVRKIAKKSKLPVAEKKDSQGICFLGDIDLKDFLKHYIKEKKGDVLNEEGEVVGCHNGATFFTLGERRGFTITKKTPEDKPYYVVAKDIKKNILYVSHSKYENQQNKNLKNSSAFALGVTGQGTHDALNFSNFCFVLENCNWNMAPEENKKYTAQVRYHGELFLCTLEKDKKDNYKIYFDKNVLVASGQSVVVYQDNICLGGGVVV